MPNKKYAYFVINDTDDLDALQGCLGRFASEIDDTVIDYSMDKKLRLPDLIKASNRGDFIYTPYLGRIANSLGNLYDIVSLANEKGVDIFFCDKECAYFSQNSAIGKPNISALEWAAKLDYELKSTRTKAAKARDKDSVNRNGYFVNEAGEPCSYVGMPKWDSMSDAQQQTVLKMQEASILAKQEAAMKWREQSAAVRFTLRKYAEGWTVTQITDELGKL